jgi:hypothetical protein
MARTLRNLFVELTTTATVLAALTLAGFGFRQATEPRLDWSGSRRERHLIRCPECRDPRLPIEEQLRRCPDLVDLQRQLLNEWYPDAEERPPTVVAIRRLASVPGAE